MKEGRRKNTSNIYECLKLLEQFFFILLKIKIFLFFTNLGSKNSENFRNV